MNEADGINLYLGDYCSYCADFEPDIKKIDISNVGEPRRCITNIRCENRSLCDRLKEHFNKEDADNEESLPYKEQPTECDICTRLSECIKEKQVLQTTTRFDTIRHFVPGLDGCPKWRD